METQRKTLAKPLPHDRDQRRWFMLSIVQCASLMGILDGFIVNVAVPSIEQQLHVSFAEMQLVVAGYIVAYAVLLITGGRLGDMYGHKRLFLLGVASFTLCSALCGLAPNVWLLISFRIAQGMAAALMSPQVIAFIQVSFDADERPLAFGSYTAVAGLGSVMRQVFGGFLLTANLFNLGWRSIFLVNVPTRCATSCYHAGSVRFRFRLGFLWTPIRFLRQDVRIWRYTRSSQAEVKSRERKSP